MTTPFMPSQLYADEKQWTKGASARDATGNLVDEKSPDATCWCLSGRIARLLPATCGVYQAVSLSARKLFPERAGYPIGAVVRFNDHKDTTFADVKAVLADADRGYTLQEVLKRL